MEQENKPNLIKKLKALLHGKKLSQKLATLVLATSIAIIPLTACSNNNNNVTPNTPPSQNQQQGGNEQTNTSKYSELLQGVLNDNYINYLIDVRNSNPSSANISYFKGIPFSFLEDQGHNIEKFKTGEYDCITRTMIKDNEPNNLYMFISAENAGNYYTNYMVKYTLQEKEISEYKMLHGIRGDWYYQAMFMNDAIAKTKTPTILSKANISIEAHNNLNSLEGVAGLNSMKTIIGTKNVKVFLKEFDVKKQTFSVYVFNNVGSSQKTNIEGKFTTIPLIRQSKHVYAENGVLLRPSLWGEFYYDSSFSLDWPTEDVEVFDTYNVDVVKDFCTDFNKEA